MASVFERDGKWYLRVKDARGRWVRQASTAGSKTQARRLAADLERRYERQRLGLDLPPDPTGGGTVGALLAWWLETYAKLGPAHSRTASTVRANFEGSPLAGLRLADVTSGVVESFLQEKATTLAPRTVNHLRGIVLAAFNRAREAGRYTGPNPAVTVRRRKTPNRLPEYLHLDEVPRVLAALDRRWRPLFATAIYTGLRKGELAALRRSDVDLAAGLIVVRRSWERDTTKGGHADAIPIAAELVPFLEQALDAAPGELVFPGPDGAMMRTDHRLEAVLRRAMGRAGIVTAYRHVCRRKGCGHAEQAQNAALRRCPEDGRSLWPRPLVRPIRFHDLRHTTASLLVQLGASLAAVQRILRHSDPRITTEFYAHLTPRFLKAEIDRLALDPPPVALGTTPEAALRAVDADSFSPQVAQDRADPSTERSPRPPKPNSVRGLKWRALRELNPRPTGSKPGALSS
jgi:integrase